MFIESPPWVPHALLRGGDALVGPGHHGVSAVLVSVVVAEAVLVDQRQHLAPPLVVDDPAALLRIIFISLAHSPFRSSGIFDDMNLQYGLPFQTDSSFIAQRYLSQ